MSPHLLVLCSGGHFNPAVSVGAWLAGDKDVIQTAAYWVCQLTGGILGSVITRVSTKGHILGSLISRVSTKGHILGSVITRVSTNLKGPIYVGQ